MTPQEGWPKAWSRWQEKGIAGETWLVMGVSEDRRTGFPRVVYCRFDTGKILSEALTTFLDDFFKVADPDKETTDDSR